MRHILLAIILIVTFAKGFANTVGIKEISHEGQKAFVLQVTATTQKSAAIELQNKLSKSVPYPVTIENPSNKGIYLVQVGPIQDIDSAHDLQQKLSLGDNTTIIDNNNSQIPTAVIGHNNKSKHTKKLWNLRNADIRAVIAEVSRVTGRNFVVDPRVQGKISIISSTPMGDKELYQVFLAALQVSGYATVDSGAITKIVPNMEAKTISPDLLNLIKNPPKGDEMLVEVIPVHYVPAEQLVPVLRPLMPQWSSVSAYNPSNMLILSGRASNVRQLSQIIKQVDSSSAGGIDMIPLRHALAMDVTATLKDLVKSQSGGASTQNQVMIAADDRTNSILISGNKTERIRIRLLLAKLDKVQAHGTESNTQVVYLNYMRAEDVVPILAGIAQANFSGNVGTTIGTITRPALDSTNPASSLVDAGQGAAKATPAANSAATPNTTGASTQNEGSSKPTVQIIAEPNTNAVILNAPATLIHVLKSVIGQLDIRPAQLLIQALVVEINETDLNSLGIEWGSNSQTGKPSTDFRPGFAIINSKTSINDMQAQIYALAQKHKANILSTPSVVVLDNRQAKILIGKQVSVASTNYPNNAGGTAAASSPYTTFDRVNVALHLYVRPQITRSNGIQMQIDQGNDTLDPTSALSPTTTPTFNISSIVTSVHIENGDTIVLGGLAQNGLGNESISVPILGDIPGIGKLFQHNVKNHEKKVLMVFISPQILRTERDELMASGKKYNATREDQLELLQSIDYEQRNKKTLLPLLHPEALPKPFSQNPANMSK